MNMIERVAREIADTDLDDGDGLYDWFALTEEVADKYYALARAAIEAMMKPTTAMDQAGGLVTYIHSYDADPSDVYQAMIRAALEEK